MRKLALLLAFSLFLFGCIEQTISQAQGIISPPSSANATAAANASLFMCADGKTASDKSLCSACATNCSDSNPCTRDYCDEATAQCAHLPLDGTVEGCAGFAGTCLQYSCSRGTCSKIPSDICCGDEKRSPGETCASCPQDVKCASGELCCAAGCTKPACKSDADCDDRVLGTKDSCESPGGCDAKCMHSPIRECIHNDMLCPFGCSSATDSDCKVQTTGSTTYISDDFILSFSNPHVQSCKIANKSFFDNYIIYDVTFENRRSASYPLFLQDFYARSATYGLDSERINRTEDIYRGENYAKTGEQHPSLRNPFSAAVPILTLPNDYEPPCSSSERFLGLLQAGNVPKGSLAMGRVWIKVGSNGDYEKGLWTMGYTPKLTPDTPVEAQIYIK